MAASATPALLTSEVSLPVKLHLGFPTLYFTLVVAQLHKTFFRSKTCPLQIVMIFLSVLGYLLMTFGQCPLDFLCQLAG